MADAISTDDAQTHVPTPSPGLPTVPEPTHERQTLGGEPAAIVPAPLPPATGTETALEWCAPEENFALDADELANRAARALKVLVDNPGRTSQSRLLEAMRHLTAGLAGYLLSRAAYTETSTGKVLLADAIGDPENSGMMNEGEVKHTIDRAIELSREMRDRLP